MWIYTPEKDDGLPKHDLIHALRYTQTHFISSGLQYNL